MQPVAFVQNTRDEVRLFGGDGDSVGGLSAQPGMKQQCYIADPVAFDCKASSRNDLSVGADSPTLRSMDGADGKANGGGQVAIMKGMAVRRLTPTECERFLRFAFTLGLSLFGVTGEPEVVRLRQST